MANWAEPSSETETRVSTALAETAVADSNKVICRCLGITTEQVERATDIYGATSLREIRDQTGAGDGCTSCHRFLKKVLDARR